MRSTLKLVAVYQLASAAFMALTVFNSLWDKSLSLFACALLAINLVAGIGLWRHQRWAEILSLWNIAAQIPAINSSFLTYWYIGIGDIYLFAIFSPTGNIFGPSFYAWPGTIEIVFGAAIQGVQIYVGIFATIFTILIVRGLRKRQQLSSLQQLADRFD